MHQELIASDVSPRVSKSDCQADFSSTSLINLILAMPEFWELLFRHSLPNVRIYMTNYCSFENMSLRLFPSPHHITITLP